MGNGMRSRTAILSVVAIMAAASIAHAGEGETPRLVADVEACQVRCPDGTWVNVCGPNPGSCAAAPSTPDYCERHPERCTEEPPPPPPPSTLNLHTQTFRNELASFASYLDVYRFTSAPD